MPLPEGDIPLNLTVLPEPPRRPRSDLNRAQQKDLTHSAEVCAAALKPEYAATLNAGGISNDFVIALVNDIAKAGEKVQAAVQSTNARKAATRAQATAEAKLVDSLRTVQAAARQKHLPSNPEALGNYHVGKDINQSRPLLEAYSQNVIQQANEERPPGVNTEVVERLTNERAAYVQTGVAQSTEMSKGKQDRAERDALVKDIIARRKKIQYAADRIWPAGLPESAQARSDFKLPENRPYSY